MGQVAGVLHRHRAVNMTEVVCEVGLGHVFEYIAHARGEALGASSPGLVVAQ